MPNTTRLGNFLPYLLSITANTVSVRLAQEYRVRFGLNVPEWRVMAVLGDSGALTQRQLSKLTIMDKVAVNRACKGLEKRALIRRQPNETDGRSHHLELTEAGYAMHIAIMPLALELERRLFSSFTEDELETFQSVLARIRGEVAELSAEDIDFGRIS
jgi:DNA-binding MarR family transcriptional regulator